MPARRPAARGCGYGGSGSSGRATAAAPRRRRAAWRRASRNRRPEPATRSRTIAGGQQPRPDARPSRSALAIWSARPPISSSRISSSPVWTPQRSRRPSRSAGSREAHGAAQARAGPSKHAIVPSGRVADRPAAESLDRRRRGRAIVAHELDPAAVAVAGGAARRFDDLGRPPRWRARDHGRCAAARR